MNTQNPCPCGSPIIENKDKNLCSSCNRKARIEPKEKTVYKIPPQSKKGKERAEKLKEVKNQITRKAKESNQYFCRGCLTTSEHLDRSHILSVAQRPDLATDENNIQLLCRICHTKWESGNPTKMTQLLCFLKDLEYIHKNDEKRFNQIFFKLLDENEARPNPKISSLILKIERFV